MRIVSVTMVRNEADVLEAFIRHHAQIFDEMVVVLHGESEDGAHDSIVSLRRQGFPIVITKNAESTYRQSKIVTETVQSMRESMDIDVLVPLDCDEFLVCASGTVRDALEALPAGHVFLAPWRTFVPKKIGWWPEALTHRRSHEDPGFSKVIIPREFLQPSLTIGSGSHNVLLNDQHVPATLHNRLWIAHAPIRSPEQAYLKACRSWPQERDNPDRKPGQSYHWESLYERSRRGPFTHNDAIEIAATYGCTRKDVCPTLVEDPFVRYVPAALQTSRGASR